MRITRVWVAAFVLWSVAVFGAGWAWRGDRAEGTEARADAATVKQSLRVEQQTRAIEHRQAEALAEIGEDHEQDRKAAEAIPASVVADLRTGNLRLRNDLATCSTSLLSQAVTGSIERDASAQLRAEVAADLVRIGRDADDQVRACQAVIATDRAKGP